MLATPHSLLNEQQIQKIIREAKQSQGKYKNSLTFSALGEQASDLIGSGMDFADRQPYSYGDDPRHIDWRASARAQTTLIRRYHSELSIPCCIVIDRSQSLFYGTKKRLKITQAIRAGIHFGAQRMQAGHQVAFLILDEPPYWQSPQINFNALSKTAMLAAKTSILSNNPVKWSSHINYLRTKIPTGSQVIWISDFQNSHSQSEANTKALSQLSQQYALSLVCIKDDSELKLKHSKIDLAYESSLSSINTFTELKSINDDLDQYHQDLNHQLKKISPNLLTLMCQDNVNGLKI